MRGRRVPLTRLRRSLPAAVLTVAAGLAAAACGSEGDSVSGQNTQVQRGSVLFAQRCAGCHTLNVAGTQGGATQVGDRERTDGPNFNVRHETVQSVLYAIRNGGFSGAIMPENIVVGKDAQDVAAFLSKYAGTLAGQRSAPVAEPNSSASAQP
jgi:mono/diheme cytochrome c family protein